MKNNWQQILRKNNYPTTVVVLDFESYFDKGYSLSNLSNIEYVLNNQFEFTGLGIFESKQPFDDPRNAVFWPPDAVESTIARLQAEYGPNFEKCTLVGQNLMFDALILKEKFGILPKYTVDTLNLARHEDSRRKNSLAKLCEYYILGVQKGDSKQFKDLHWADMSPTQQNNMAKYCRTDIIATTELFRLLLPRLSSVNIELQIQQHTLEMYLQPQFGFNFKLAENLQNNMKKKLNETLDKVSWVLEYEN